MKKIAFLLTVVLSFCSFKKEPILSNFDKIEYYHLVEEDNNINGEITPEKIIIFENNLKKNGKILDGSFVKLSNEKNYILEFDSKKFIKKQFSTADISEFLKFFNTDVFLDYDTKACAPEYRDFLILKKNDKTVGIVQICLQCQMHTIEGRDQRNKKINFGGCIEMSQANKIETLLKKYQTQ